MRMLVNRSLNENLINPLRRPQAGETSTDWCGGEPGHSSPSSPLAPHRQGGPFTWHFTAASCWPGGGGCWQALPYSVRIVPRARLRTSAPGCSQPSILVGLPPPSSLLHCQDLWRALVGILDAPHGPWRIVCTFPATQREAQSALRRV